MSPNKFRISLIVGLGVLALVLIGLSFFTIGEIPVIQEFLTKPSPGSSIITIDFGDGATKTLKIQPDGVKTLFQIMKERFSEEGIELNYETYSGLGEFITQIGDKKNGEEDSYWQFWVNGAYSQVGASSYIVKVGDIIKWKFTNEKQ